VGGAAQTAAIRAVAGKLRLELSQFEEVARFARFGTEVDEATQRQIRRGERLRAVLSQPAHQPLSLAAQVVVLLAATEGYLDDVALEDVPDLESSLLAYIEAAHPEIGTQIDRSGELTAEMRESLTEAIATYRTAWREGHPRTCGSPREPEPNSGNAHR
jgi:F-type H+-transporting ATPase subunit alpha